MEVILLRVLYREFVVLFSLFVLFILILVLFEGILRTIHFDLLLITITLNCSHATILELLCLKFVILCFLLSCLNSLFNMVAFSLFLLFTFSEVSLNITFVVPFCYQINVIFFVVFILLKWFILVQLLELFELFLENLYILLIYYGLFWLFIFCWVVPKKFVGIIFYWKSVIERSWRIRF